jgi:hypothetical protein
MVNPGRNIHQPMKVFLSGEGKNDLGSRAGDPVYQTDEQPGVLQALLYHIQPDGWTVGGARDWKNTRKFQVRRDLLPRTGHDDARNVAKLAVDAIENQCDVLAFIRDRDNDPDREQAIENGIAFVESEFPRPPRAGEPPRIIGGVAVPKLEGWILAASGVRGSESLSPGAAEQELADNLGHEVKTADMVAVVERADLAKLPHDATRLYQWLNRARQVLP